MSKRSQEKRRARAKEKKLAKRRIMGSSPLSRLAGEETCECWLGYEKEIDRKKLLRVLRDVRGGGTVAVDFMLDYDGFGVKNAHCVLDVDRSFAREHMRAASRDGELTFAKVELTFARREVAAAAAWSRTKGFRPPENFDRCVRVLGGIGEALEEDLKAFGIGNGKVLVTGTHADIERRLAGQTLQEFMAREDVQYIMEVDDDDFDERFYDSDDDTLADSDAQVDALDESEIVDHVNLIFSSAVQPLAEQVRAWCRETGRKPAESLPMVIGAFLRIFLGRKIDKVSDPYEAAARQIERDIETGATGPCKDARPGWDQFREYTSRQRDPNAFVSSQFKQAIEKLVLDDVPENEDTSHPFVDVEAVRAAPEGTPGKSEPDEVTHA